MRDRATDLLAMPDLWPAIVEHLDAAATDAVWAVTTYSLDLQAYTRVEMVAALQSKWDAGEREHGRDWLNMTSEDIEAEIRNEIRDLVLYHAMLLARWVSVDAPPFDTNSDPGDEQA